MEIQVKGYLTFKLLLGEQKLFFNDSQPPTLRDVLEELFKKHSPDLEKFLIDPQSGELSRQASVLVNGRHHSHMDGGLESKLKEGDQVAIFPPLAGGRGGVWDR
jgi:sulfur-carrier protein